VVEAEKTINHFHPPFIKEWRLCFEWWNDLAQNHSLSLVHMDAHTGNFNINNSGQVCLFDFDDCAWNFLSYDLAVAILGLFRLTKEQDEKNKLKASFIASYLSEYQLEQIWVDRIDSFRRLRAIEMLAWYLRMYGIKEDKKAGEIEYFEKLFSESPALI